MKKKDKVRRSDNISGIEEVQIGLENGEWKENYYEDTGERVKDGDFAYRIEMCGVFDTETIYFEEYENARDYLRDFE